MRKKNKRESARVLSDRKSAVAREKKEEVRKASFDDFP
jgi:hypothetical protein